MRSNGKSDPTQVSLEMSDPELTSEHALTIAICAYNASKRLPPVLEAIARQKVSPDVRWEVAVVDNASTDDTRAVAIKMARTLGMQLRIIAEPVPGLSAARRRAALEAHGEILSFIDDDNLIEEDWVEQCVRFFREHLDAGIAGGKVYPIFEDPLSKPANFDEIAEELAIRDLGEKRLLLSGKQMPPCGAGMTGRTAVFRQILCDVGLYLSDRKGEALTSGGDTEIGFLARQLGWETWYTPTLRLGHVLPRHRLTPEYRERLIAGFCSSQVWLSVLSGEDPPRHRTGYALLAARKQLGLFLKKRLVGLGLKRRSEEWTAWERNGPAVISAYWAMFRDNPYRHMKRRLNARGTTNV